MEVDFPLPRSISRGGREDEPFSLWGKGWDGGALSAVALSCIQESALKVVEHPAWIENTMRVEVVFDASLYRQQCGR